jgi:hypothetical protein
MVILVLVVEVELTLHHLEKLKQVVLVVMDMFVLTGNKET